MLQSMSTKSPGMVSIFYILQHQKQLLWLEVLVTFNFKDKGHRIKDGWFNLSCFILLFFYFVLIDAKSAAV